MDMRFSIAVILTVHNRREKTVSCLRHLFAAAEAAEGSVSLTVFLTDDGCTDGTAEAVRQEFPQLSTLNSQLLKSTSFRAMATSTGQEA